MTVPSGQRIRFANAVPPFFFQDNSLLTSDVNPIRSLASEDVRMRGFARRTSVHAAQAWVDQHAVPLGSEVVELGAASGRVLAEDLRATLDVPTFARAMMDGFAVHAEDTQGATPYNALALRVIGQSYPGRPFEGTVSPRECVRIMTGAPMPRGANAVLPVEKVADVVSTDGREEVHVHADVAEGKHVGPRGEDLRDGDLVLSAGCCLRPQDLGVAASLGRARLDVVQRPRVRIIITGNELLNAGATHKPAHVFDANGPMLEALAVRDGALVERDGITADDPKEILTAMRGGSSSTPALGDVVLISGGSSVGEEDHAACLLAKHGELAIHGIAMRPSSPSGIGRICLSEPLANNAATALVFLLPGNPVSCLCAYDFFAGRAIRALGGHAPGWPYPECTRPLARKLVSQVGRLDYARVRIDDGGTVHPLAIGAASVLSSTVHADGFVVIPHDCEGYPAGTDVRVWLYGTTTGNAPRG